jgi:hypothetical protein
MRRPNGELVPSVQALELIDLYVESFDRQQLLAHAWAGSHAINPYHNVIHELQHAYWAFTCATNECTSYDVRIEPLLIASLFHDHNHSGGVEKDDVNIQRATAYVKQFFPMIAYLVTPLIEVTQFMDGRFTKEPETLREKAMRDADLMSIYSVEGRGLLLGLFDETMRKPLGNAKREEVRDWLQRNEEFLLNATMYTTLGRNLRREHLAKALSEFERVMWGRWQYEVVARDEG